MQRLKCSLVLISICFFSGTLLSQEPVKVLDQVYGLDQTLYNGKKYEYIAPLGTGGHPFLRSILFYPGSVTLKGISYHDIKLNYDIFNQQLLLQYADNTSPWNVIEVSTAWLTNFSLGSMNFERRNLEQQPRFYQVLGEGNVQILYFWRKNLNLNDAIGSSNFIFSPAVRDSYILTDGQLKPFSTKRSLVRLFAPGMRPEIKKYMRKNKVKIKKASDQVMAEMITFIGNIK